MTEEGRGWAGVRGSTLFGVVSPSSGWFPPIRFLLRRRRILRLLAGLPPGRLVEVGCGAGAMLVEFTNMGHSVTGLETSAQALAMARSLAANAREVHEVVDEASAEWLEAVDLVCAFDVLEHIEDDGQALDEWRSWLRPDGRLCLSVPAHQSRWGAGDEWAGHYRRYDRRDLESLLAAHGYRVEYLECYGFPLANLTEWLGERTYRRLMAERATGTSLAQATATSGVDRRDARGLFRWIDTPPGRLGLRLALMAQAAFARTDWGSGYLVLARKS